jgi:uncharacterized protein (DUF305 family)
MKHSIMRAFAPLFLALTVIVLSGCAAMPSGQGQAGKIMACCCKEMMKEGKCACCKGGKCPMSMDELEKKMPAMDMGGDIYGPAMNDMHGKMMLVQPTGDADADFMLEMIPHHEGAIGMAEAALAHAKDPEVRKLAADIIASQEKEVALMKKWLAAHKH